MAHINRRYIDSHWLTFAIKGALAVVFGWLMLFHGTSTLGTSVSVIGLFLLTLSVIEFVNALHRAHSRTGWVISVLVAVFDAAAALILLFGSSAQSITLPLFTVASYTLIRGVSEIIIGFRTTVDPTDRFIWIITGIAGAVMGLVIFNSGSLPEPTVFIRFFGSFVLVFGISNLIYGIHNRSQKAEDTAARLESAKSRKKSKKSAKKSSPKSKKK